MRRLLLGMAAAAALWALPARADDAHDLEAARALANSGREFYERGEYAKALQRFESAEQIFHAPPHVLFIARTKRKLGKLLEAREAYQRLIAEKLGDKAPEAFHNAQGTAAEELAELDQHVPKLVFKLKGPTSATITVDGAKADSGKPFAVEPGPHDVAVAAEGYKPLSRHETVREGETSHAVELAPEPLGDKPREAPKPSTVPIGPIAVLAGGGAVLIGGGIAGGIAMSKMSQLKKNCADLSPCPSENAPLRDQTRTVANVSTALFVIGGVAAAAGATWLALDLAGVTRKTEEKSGVRLVPLIGLGSAGIQGEF